MSITNTDAEYLTDQGYDVITAVNTATNRRSYLGSLWIAFRVLNRDNNMPRSVHTDPVVPHEPDETKKKIKSRRPAS